jgi:hypothetical protein
VYVKKYKALLVVSLVLMVGISPVVLGTVKNKLNYTIDGESAKTKVEKDGSVWVKLPKGFVLGTVANEDKLDGKVNAANYKKALVNGKTYAEVCKILGEGVLEKSSSDYFSSKLTERYVWETKHASVMLAFVDGKLDTKQHNEYHKRSPLEVAKQKELKKMSKKP